MKWIIAGLLFGLMVLVAGHVRAEPRINNSGMEVPTQEQILACGWDARRFCGPYLVPNLATAMGGDARAILHVCMQAHERQLSQRCRDAFR